MIGRQPRLPVHVALGAALVLVAAVPAVVTWGVHAEMERAAAPGPGDLQNARVFLADGVSSWTDPAWQTGARAYLASIGVDAEVRPLNGPQIDLSAGHRDPAPGAGDKFIVHGSGDTGAIVGSGWVAASPLAPVPAWGEPVAAGAVALLAVLAALAGLVSRTVARPLAAMSQAARAIADGDLDVRLHLSPVREVADAAAAMEAMSVRLGSALQHQAELEQERRLFVGAIAHDLRTPLFTLRAYLEGLRDGLAAEPDRAAHYVDVCLQKTASLDRLVSDLFSFSQLELLDPRLQRERLEVGALLRRCLAGLELKMASSRLRLEAAGTPEPCFVAGDEHLLARVVDNLLDNAARHTPDGGLVRVRWAREGNSVVFEVEDTGPGIAGPDLPHLFEPLYRGEASRNRATGGAGLGLSIAQRIVRAHRGELSVANTAAGHAVFTTRLPAVR